VTRYEQVCRWLLAAYPPDFRADRGDDLVATLIDDAPPGAHRVSVRTAANVVGAGLRMRASHAGVTRSVRGSVRAGVEVSAVAAIGLQAAVALASAVYFVEHGMLFYLNGSSRATELGAQHRAAWMAVALVCWAALVAAVRGHRRTAALLSVAATTYTLVVAAIMIHFQSAIRIGWIEAVAVTGGSKVRSANIPGGEFTWRYQNFVSTPALLAIGVIASVIAVIVAWRRRPAPSVTRSWTWTWLVGMAALAGLLALVGDGSGAIGSGPDVSYSIPPQGGIMTAFQYLWLVGVVVGILWSRLDPRVGWAAAILSMPFFIYQISSLTVGSVYYGNLYQPWWKTDLPLIGASTGIAVLTASAATASRKLRRL
jgi:hypothetical protein